MPKKGLPKKIAKTLADFVDSRSESKELEAHAKELQPDLIDYCHEVGQKKISTVDNEQGLRYEGTLVESSSMVLDAEKLRKRVGAKTWAKISSRQLDQSKLEEAVKNGLVDPKDVAVCSEEVHRAPYIRGSAKPLRDA